MHAWGFPYIPSSYVWIRPDLEKRRDPVSCETFAKIKEHFVFCPHNLRVHFEKSYKFSYLLFDIEDFEDVPHLKYYCLGILCFVYCIIIN